MSVLFVLLEKELLDVVRDRRTVVLTLVLPVLLYPGILTLMGAIIAAGKDRLKHEPLVVAVTTADAQRFLDARAPPPHTTWRRVARPEAEALLRDKKVAAIVDAKEGAAADVDGGRQATVTVLYTKRFDRSMEALERVRPVLEAAGARALRLRLEARALDPAFATPVKLEAVDLDFQKELGPLIASRLLPVVLLMMLFIGALYPAVDLTAGEKERGTLETLLVCPVRPVQVMAAKYLTVALVSVVSTLVNLGAMAGTFGAGLSLAGEGASTSLRFTAGQVAVMLACLVPAALLVSGVALAVSSMARTFKEGQSLMTPVMLAGLAPALVSQMPGIELTTVTALVPLLNVALLVKAAVLGTATAATTALTVGSVLVSAALALKWAASAFDSEVFRFGGTPGWAKVWAGRKRG
ncbi:MAG: ABC transporter permease [Myxococcota bacterium]